ncbi:MAG: DUF3592 domain-containing protein [Anaerolineae bacterium]|nr:MAG: DUF3592 domain-containing protein [Anaerolineae bacterium]
MTDKPDVLDRAGGCLERLGNLALLLILNLVFIGLFFWGYYYFQNSLHLSRNGVDIPAVVVLNIRSEDAEGGEVFTPLFEYTYEGQTYTVEGNVASYPPQYDLGESETLLVDPADPARAGVHSWVDLWGATAGLWAGAGIGALVTNGAALFSLFKRKPTG